MISAGVLPFGGPAEEASAGGKSPEKLPEALDVARERIRSLLS